MLNRIRVVTLLMLVLVVFALLQLISGGFLFSSLHQNQQSFALSNTLRTQQTELTSAKTELMKMVSVFELDDLPAAAARENVALDAVPAVS